VNVDITEAGIVPMDRETAGQVRQAVSLDDSTHAADNANSTSD